MNLLKVFFSVLGLLTINYFSYLSLDVNEAIFVILDQLVNIFGGGNAYRICPESL